MGRKNERIAKLEKQVAEMEAKFYELEKLLPEFKDKVYPPDINPHDPWIKPYAPYPHGTDRFCSVCGRDNTLAGSGCYRTDCPMGFSPVGPTWTRD